MGGLQSIVEPMNWIFYLFVLKSEMVLLVILTFEPVDENLV